MTGAEIVKRALRYKNFVYWYGAKGQRCTQALLNQLAGLYPGIYTLTYVRKCRDDIQAGKWAVDCSGLVCLAYGCEQIGTAQMLQKFHVWQGSPADGMIVWKDGHCGIYYNGRVIEARGIDYDITTSRKYIKKQWQKVLYLPEVNYIGGKVEHTPIEYINAALAVISGDYGNGPSRRTKLESEGYNYERVQNIINAAYKEDKT